MTAGDHSGSTNINIVSTDVTVGGEETTPKFTPCSCIPSLNKCPHLVTSLPATRATTEGAVEIKSNAGDSCQQVLSTDAGESGQKVLSTANTTSDCSTSSFVSFDSVTKDQNGASKISSRISPPCHGEKMLDNHTIFESEGKSFVTLQTCRPQANYLPHSVVCGGHIGNDSEQTPSNADKVKFLSENENLLSEPSVQQFYEKQDSTLYQGALSETDTSVRLVAADNTCRISLDTGPTNLSALSLYQSNEPGMLGLNGEESTRSASAAATVHQGRECRSRSPIITPSLSSTRSKRLKTSRHRIGFKLLRQRKSTSKNGSLIARSSVATQTHMIGDVHYPLPRWLRVSEGKSY